MEVSGIVKVNGTSEREFKGKIYRSVNLYIDGIDGDSIRAGLPDTAPGLVKQAHDLVDKRCKAVFNLRNFKGSLYLDLVSLEPVPVTGTHSAKA